MMFAGQKWLTAVAWMVTLLASSLTLIVWRTLGAGEPYWWAWVVLLSLVAIFAVSLASPSLRPLRGFIVIILTIFVLGFGGGWQWGLIPYIRSSPGWIVWVGQVPWAISSVATHILRLLPALTLLAFLFLVGRRRRDLFLVRGDINANASPSRLLRMKRPEPWIRLGTIFTVIFTVCTFAFLALTSWPSGEAFLAGLPLIPVAVLIALINSFNEEFTLRAAPLSELRSAVGDRQALLLTTVFFGLGHYYGIPNGVIGVVLSGFLGWFLGKSMLETRGFFWAWLGHFLPDVVIFTFLAVSVAG